MLNIEVPLKKGLTQKLGDLGYHLSRHLDVDGVMSWVYPTEYEAEMQTIIDGYTTQDEVKYEALQELKELDGYFLQPRVIEDAMRGTVTPEHHAKMDRRDELRLIVSAVE